MSKGTYQRPSLRIRLESRLRYARWEYNLYWKYRHLGGGRNRVSLTGRKYKITWPYAAEIFVKSFFRGIPCGWKQGWWLNDR